MEKITKEQVQEYINDNFDSFFVDALAKYIRELLAPDDTSKQDLEDYKSEIKQLIWKGISYGTKEFLEEYDGEAVKIISTEFLEHLSKKRISIQFNKDYP